MSFCLVPVTNWCQKIESIGTYLAISQQSTRLFAITQGDVDCLEISHRVICIS